MKTTEEQKPIKVFRITGDWKAQSNQLRAKYPELTDEDLKFEPEKENDLVERIETKLLLKRIKTKLGKSYNEVVKIMRSVQPVEV
jgi:hypothetical protein